MLNHSKLYFTKTGSGNNPVIFFHGLWGGGNYFREFDYSFLPLGHLYFPDQLGFGKSPKPNVNYTPELHVQKINEILPNGKYTLIANSFGCIIALYFAKLFPDKVKQIVLISPVLHKDKKEAQKYLSSRIIPKITIYFPLLGQIICTITCKVGLLGFFAPYFSHGHKKKFIGGTTTHTWHSYYSTFINGFLNEPLTSSFEKIINSFPTLILYGENDNYVNPATIASLKGKNVTLHTMKHANHNVYFEKFEDCNEVIRKWLTK